MVGLTRSVQLLVAAWIFWVGALAGLVSWKQPITPVKILGGISGLWFLALIVIALISFEFRAYLKDWWPPSPAAYKPNPANTIITLLIATAVLPILYWKTWDPDLNRSIITLERDRVVRLLRGQRQ